MKSHLSQILKYHFQLQDRTLDVVGKFDSFKKWHLSSKYTSESTIDKAINKWPIIAEAVSQFAKELSVSTTKIK